MSLKETLAQKKQEENQSTGMNTSEEINYRTRLAEIEHQNELIARRIDQLANNIEKNNNNMNENMKKVLELNKQNNQALNEKVSSLKNNQEVLVDSFNETLNGYFKQLTGKVGKDFEERTDQVADSFSNTVQKIENQFQQQSEKKQKNATVLENMKFIFANVFFVLVAVVLTRALFYGFWDGFNIKGFYEWGSQWKWLNYTMWSLFVVIIGLLVWSAFEFVRKNFKRF